MINLKRLIEGGKTILCIGNDTAVGEYPLGKGYVYCRSFESVEPLPETIDILVWMHEPIGEIRQKLTALVVEGGDIHEAWKES